MSKKRLFSLLAIPAVGLLTIPLFLSKNGGSTNKKLEPATYQLPQTNLTLTPLSASDLEDFATTCSSHNYVIGLLENDILYFFTFYNGSMYYEKTQYGENYSIDVDANYMKVVNSILSIEVTEGASQATSVSPNYIAFHSIEYFSSICHFSDYGKEYIYFEHNNDTNMFTYTIGNNGLLIETEYYNSSTSTMGTGYLTFKEDYEVIGVSDNNNGGELLIYQLPDTFYTSYSWVGQFNAITSSDDATSLLSMWQSLTAPQKCFILDRFYVDPDDPYGSSGYEPGTESYDVWYIALSEQYAMYLNIVSAEYEHPFACADPVNLEIDYSANTIKGLTNIDAVLFIDSNDPENEIFFPYEFVSELSLDNPDGYLLGGSFDCYFCADWMKEYSRSNPYHLDFKPQNTDTTEIAEEPPMKTTSLGSIEGQEVSVVNNFGTSFTLSSIPSGYEVALLDYDCFFNNAQPYMDDEEVERNNYSSNKLFFTDELTFEKAYDMSWELVPLTPDTDYYLIYRLKETSTQAPSRVIDYYVYHTEDVENSFANEMKVENYELYQGYFENERFASALAIDQDNQNLFYSKYVDNYQMIESGYASAGQYFEERGLDDQFYYQASYLLLDSETYQIEDDAAGMILNSAVDSFDVFFGYGELNRPLVDAYVDSLLLLSRSAGEFKSEMCKEMCGNVVNYFFVDLQEGNLDDTNMMSYMTNIVDLISFGEELITDRSMGLCFQYVNNYMEDFRNGELSADDFANYVTEAKQSMSETFSLYDVQQEAAANLCDYFNAMIKDNFVGVKDVEGAWNILNTYLQMIYEETDVDNIPTLVEECKQAIVNYMDSPEEGSDSSSNG